MAIDKRLIPAEVDIEGSNDLAVELPPEEEFDFDLVEEEENDDGSVIIDFDPSAAENEEGEHLDNLVEHIEEGVLTTIATELVQAYEDDKLTREPWEKAYIKGLSLLGMQIEDRTQPWAGASGVFHPILTEAVTKFVADAMMETFPASGPVLTKIIGKTTPERVKQAKRVQKDMNYQCIEVMKEYRDEHEQALFHLGVGGSVFKKVYFDQQLGRQTVPYIMADDFVVAYGTTNLQTCPRATHVMKMWPNDLKKKQYSGEYADVDIPKPSTQYDKVDEKEDKIAGSAPSAEKDDRHTMLEIHVDYDLPGFEDVDDNNDPTEIAIPYIFTIEKDSQTIVSIYRNWREDDEKKLKRDFFIQYKYLPGLGFYGMGLVHLLGGIAKSATSILRQLIDAGTLSNLPAGLKARGLRIKGDDSPLRPGEFRDVDVPGGAIKDNITFIPYKEPSTVLYQLLGTVVEEGRNIASIADLKISEMDNQAPVGTTLAIIERGMKVMSSVHARIHASMRQEFKLIAELVKDFQPKEYEYDVEDGATRAQDYDERIDVLPISNPNASTMAQRIMQNQAVLQLQQMAPEVYDKKLLHRQMIDAMGIDNPDKIIPLDEDRKPMDPVAENMAIITGKPLKAFIHQDHESHIRVHLAAAEDPKIQSIIRRSPVAKSIEAAAAAHVQEHVAFQYRREIEKQLGVPMPDYDKPLPAEAEAMLSKLTADAAEKVLKKDIAEAQAQRIAEQQQDPVLQIQKLDAQTKAKEVERKGLADRLRAFLGMEQIKSKEQMFLVDTQKDMIDKKTSMERSKIDILMEIQRLLTEEERVKSQEMQTGARIGADVAMSVEDDKIEYERIASQERIAEGRGDTDLQRADIQSATSLHQTDEQAKTARIQTATTLAGKFMDVLQARTQQGQSGNKNEENG